MGKLNSIPPGASTSNQAFMLVYDTTSLAPMSAGPTALRYRITTDWTDVSQVTSVNPDDGSGNPVGATDGEVEDYIANGNYPLSSPLMALGHMANPPAHANSWVEITASSIPAGIANPALSKDRQLRCDQ